jgi:DNA-binding ferritin-like protein (Dps family)
MAASKKPQSATRGGKVSEKTPKSYRLSQRKIDAAKRILGAETETEAIETALDMVAFGHALAEGTRALVGTDVEPFDDGEELLPIDRYAR